MISVIEGAVLVVLLSSFVLLGTAFALSAHGEGLAPLVGHPPRAPLELPRSRSIARPHDSARSATQAERRRGLSLVPQARRTGASPRPRGGDGGWSGPGRADPLRVDWSTVRLVDHF